ncbi:hypothetical protein ACFXTH_006706 [Malus domestica]
MRFEGISSKTRKGRLLDLGSRLGCSPTCDGKDAIEGIWFCWVSNQEPMAPACGLGTTTQATNLVLVVQRDGVGSQRLAAWWLIAILRLVKQRVKP